MPLSLHDEDFIESGLETLCKSIVHPSDPGYGDVKQFIYVHEFGLALDLLAHIQLQSAQPLSPEIRSLIDALAVRMGMKDGDEWRAVAELLTTK